MSRGFDPSGVLGSLMPHERFHNLTIRRRTINLGTRTLHLPMVATVTLVEPAGRLFGWILIVVGVIATLTLYGAVVGVPLFIWGIATLMRETMLLISCSDGRVSALSSRRPEFLREVKAVIDERLENGGVGAPVVINTVTNRIETLNVDAIENLAVDAADAVFANSPASMYAPNSVGASTSQGNTVQVGQGAHVNASVMAGATVYDIQQNNARTSSRTATHNQAGNGSLLNVGSMNAGPVQFGPTMDEVVGFYNEIYDRDVPHQHKVMLYDLVSMMHQGIERREDRQKARGLATTLSQAFQAYPGAVQLFNHVVQLLT